MTHWAHDVRPLVLESHAVEAPLDVNLVAIYVVSRSTLSV